MEITLIIVGGLTLMTLIGVTFDYMAKKRNLVTQDAVKRLDALEQQVQILEAKAGAKDEQIVRLEEGMAFMNRLLEDKSSQKSK